MTEMIRRAKLFLAVLFTCTLTLIPLWNWTPLTASKRTTSSQVLVGVDLSLRAAAPAFNCTGTANTSANYSSQGAIPYIIHQAFSSELVYENYRPFINSCLALNPNWTYYLWRDSDAKALITDEYPQYLKRYSAYWDNLQRSDAIRYIVLHHFGGIYLDMDVECLRPFHPALTSETAFLDQERVEQTQVLWGAEFSAMNSAMGSVPGHKFYRTMADRVLTKELKGSAFDSTGPAVLTRVYKEYRTTEEAKAWPVRLLTPDVISPLMDTQKNWRSWCKGSLNANSTRLSWRQRGCRMLQSKQWRMDDTGNGTVAVHRFLHLGYSFAAGRRKLTFNVTDAFKPRVTFYRAAKCRH